MCAEIRMSIAILCFRSPSYAVVECSLQAIKISPANVRMPISYETYNVLPNALAHDPRLAVMYGKTLLQQNRSYVS